jgi:hypothetical protein
MCRYRYRVAVPHCVVAQVGATVPFRNQSQFVPVCSSARSIGRRVGDFALGVVILSQVLSRSATGQLTAPIDMQRPSPLAGSLRSLQWLGDVTSCGLAACDRAASLAAEFEPFPRLRIGAGGTARDESARSWADRATEQHADVFYGSERATIWGGRAGGEPAYGFTTPTAPNGSHFEYGGELHWRAFGLAVSGGRGSYQLQSSRPIPTSITTVLDSTSGRVSSDTIRSSDSSTTSHLPAATSELRLSWVSDRWSLTAVLGRASAVARPRMEWGGVQAARTIGTGTSLVLGAGWTHGEQLTGPHTTSRGQVNVGMSFSNPALFDQPAPRTPPPPIFSATRVAGSVVRLAFRLAGAQVIELASDVTSWRPVAMQRVGDLWQVELPIAPGVHHVNIRVDGGPWIAPPGLAAIDDDFAGTVGLFAVER